MDLKNTNHRVLFQNAEGNINMGVWFNDPDMELYDIFWLNIIAREMKNSIERKENLIYKDQELNTLSCYVELHRKSFTICYMSHIISYDLYDV